MRDVDVCDVPLQHPAMTNAAGTSVIVDLGNGHEMKAKQGETVDEMTLELSCAEGFYTCSISSLAVCRQWIRERVRFNGALSPMAADVDREGRLAGYLAGRMLVEKKSDFALTLAVLEDYLQRHFPLQLITAGNKWNPSFCPLCGSSLVSGLGRTVDDMARCEPCGLSVDIVGCENGVKMTLIPVYVLLQSMGEQFGGIAN